MARNLRRLRLLKGVSQENLAMDAGIDRTYVSRLEREMENPTVAVLETLAVALEIGIGEFFETVDPDAPPPAQLPRGRRKAR
ncbi:helix-turn-helix domain-containing protein [Zavarzinia compransoris]|uniref:helix-turn-helix domain-containing protein n=1 Tax=Zavarzinia compransoris TaxID=1264899 RepID=UPI001FB58B4D|nr:helix-turn-helix transcriptional regulator [Zavarzinia compransoris]